MKLSEQDRLAEEILQTEELAELRRNSLETGLEALRRGNAQRRAVRLGALVMAPLIVAIAVLAWGRAAFWSRRSSASDLASAGRPAAPVGTPAIKFINDDELLALFPDRPVALIGKPGEQELVFLDELVATHDAGAEGSVGRTEF